MCRIGIDDVKDPKFYVALFAEFLGTLLLVFIGCGSCSKDWEDAGDNKVKYQPTVVQISLAFGLAVATIVWMIGHISGGHINPAITIGMFVARRISLIRTILYIISQVIGGIVGAFILKAVTPSEEAGGLGAPVLHQDLNLGQGFVVELIITFILVMTVFATCDSNREDLNGSGPLTIGVSVAICHLMAIKYTCAGMNPARSFGPVIAMNQPEIWKNRWIWWVGPIVGGILAALIYELLFAVDASLVKAKNFSTNVKYDPTDVEQAPKNTVSPA